MSSVSNTHSTLALDHLSWRPRPPSPADNSSLLCPRQHVRPCNRDDQNADDQSDGDREREDVRIARAAYSLLALVIIVVVGVSRRHRVAHDDREEAPSTTHLFSVRRVMSDLLGVRHSRTDVSARAGGGKAMLAAATAPPQALPTPAIAASSPELGLTRSVGGAQCGRALRSWGSPQ